MKNKTYIISSTTSNKKNLKAIREVLLGWENAGQLYDKCRIYEVTIKKIYRPQVRKTIDLKEL